jgi:leucyl-tRNA synthetase
MLSDTPPERDIEWTEAGVEGSWRFTQRIWRLINEAAALPVTGADADAAGLRRLTHKTIAAVTDDLNNLRFNRAIARVYELANGLGAALQDKVDQAARSNAIREMAETLVLCFAPMMPHLAEECWKVLGADRAVVNTPWPKAEPALVAEDEVTIAVQVNGKRRDEIRVAKGLDRQVLEKLVLELEGVKRALDGKMPNKFIVVPDRIVNIVCLT